MGEIAIELNIDKYAISSDHLTLPSVDAESVEHFPSVVPDPAKPDGSWKKKKDAVIAKKGYSRPPEDKAMANFFTSHIALRFLMFGLERKKGVGSACTCMMDVAASHCPSSGGFVHKYLFDTEESQESEIINRFDIRVCIIHSRTYSAKSSLYHAFQILFAVVPTFKIIPIGLVLEINTEIERKLRRPTPSPVVKEMCKRTIEWLQQV